MKDNLLIVFLRLLGVKHTITFSRQYFAEHPNKYNLLGLSSMLLDYRVKNIGVKISNKNDICRIEPPFVAHIGSDFVVVEKMHDKYIYFFSDNKRVKTTVDEFMKIWTGYTLVAEPDEGAIEPNYTTNFQKELFQNISKITVLSVSVLLVILAFIYNTSYNSWVLIFLFIINFTGVFVAYLIVLKQLKVQSDYADKLCSLFKYSDCNNVLESKAAKVLGIIGWSEIGFGYFIVNLVIISLFPSFISSLLLINVFSLPYTVWSIWYQKRIAKQWCPLCLIIMLLLWTLFILGMASETLVLSSVSPLELFIICSLYVLAILTVNILIPIIAQSFQIENIKYEINSLKADEDIFEALMKKQPYFEVSKDTSKILFGNTNSDILITVFSNPHCNPCSKMHLRLNELLEHNKNICVQYIFSSFSKELEISNKYLIGAFLQKNGSVKKIYDNWFENGKKNKEVFFELYPINISSKDITDEFILHEQWKEQSGLRATPTVLINGYKLPDNLKIEDIKYITKYSSGSIK